MTKNLIIEAGLGVLPILWAHYPPHHLTVHFLPSPGHSQFWPLNLKRLDFRELTQHLRP